MANRNEPIYLERFLKEFPMSTWLASLDKGRILNIGSAEYGHGLKKFYDAFLTEREVVGVDIFSGENVQVVCDMTGDCKELQGEKFAMALCCSVLEHVERPWLMAENIEKHLMPFGLVYVSVPWAWRTHNYPNDYWRMSPAAIKSLFPHVMWKRIAWSTLNEGEFIPDGSDHDDDEPWRVLFRGRSYIAVQQVHMIGRLQ